MCLKKPKRDQIKSIQLFFNPTHANAGHQLSKRCINCASVCTNNSNYYDNNCGFFTMSDLSLRSNSCIELSEIRKLDKLLKQCESVSQEDISYETEQFQLNDYLENKRKYSSTGLLSKLTNGKKMHRFYLKDMDCSSGGIGEKTSELSTECPNSLDIFGATNKDTAIDFNPTTNKKKVSLGLNSAEKDTQSCSNLNPPKSAQAKRQLHAKGNNFTTSHEDPDHPFDVAALSKRINQKHDKSKRRKVHTANDPTTCNQIPNSLIAFTNVTDNTTSTSSTPHPFAINASESFSHNNPSTNTSKYHKSLSEDRDSDWTSHRNTDDDLEFRKITINELPSQVFNVSNVKLAPSGSNTVRSFDTKSERSEKSMMSQGNSGKSRTKFSPTFLSRKMSHVGKLAQESHDGTARESLLPAKLDIKIREPVETVCTKTISIPLRTK